MRPLLDSLRSPYPGQVAGLSGWAAHNIAELLAANFQVLEGRFNILRQEIATLRWVLGLLGVPSWLGVSPAC